MDLSIPPVDSVPPHLAARAGLLARLLRLMLLGVALAFAAIYLWMVWQRLAYPYSLEWFEGGMLRHVQRVLLGQPLYVPPSVEFTSFIYPPLFVWLSAGLAQLVGLSYLPLRLVSFVASLLAAGAVFQLVRAETANPFSGIIAAALYLAMFRISNAWYDLARVDSLLVACLLWGLCALRVADLNPARSSWKLLAAGVLFSLAYLTKQSALGPALVMAAYASLRFRWRAWPMLAALLVGIGGTSYVLNATSGGWFGFYTFQSISQHAWVRDLFINFWFKDLLGPLPIALMFGLVFGVLHAFHRRGIAFWLMAAASLCGMALLSRVHVGGGLNTLMPAYALLAVLFGLCLGTLFNGIRLLPEGWQSPAQICVCVAALVQFACLIYTPGLYVPKPADWQANAQLNARIGATTGPVFMPYHEHNLLLLGKPAWANLASMNDVLQTRLPEADTLRAEFEAAFKSHRFALVILDSRYPLPGLAEYYQQVDEIRYPPEAMPIGWFFPLMYVYVPKEQ